LEELEKLHPFLYERVIAAILPVCGIEKPGCSENILSGVSEKDHAPKDVIHMSLERLDINRRLRNAA